jgi:hypothetical protein
MKPAHWPTGGHGLARATPTGPEISRREADTPAVPPATARLWVRRGVARRSVTLAWDLARDTPCCVQWNRPQVADTRPLRWSLIGGEYGHRGRAGRACAFWRCRATIRRSIA